MKDLKAILRIVGILLTAEGIGMILCGLAVLVMFGEETCTAMILTGAGTMLVGETLRRIFRQHRNIQEKRTSYILVVGIWVVLSLAGGIPFLTTGSAPTFTDALFESTSGITSTGATIYPQVESLPNVILLWRSMSQWIGGFGIMLLVLAIVPRLGINKYSLYTAEASRADNTGKMTSSTGLTIRQTLVVYIGLTIIFVWILNLSGLPVWDAVNLTMCNISSGGFSIHNDSIASLTPVQQYILAAEMFLSGINFTLLYLIFTFQWGRITNKLDQFRLYTGVILGAVILLCLSLHFYSYYDWEPAFRYALLQSLSAATTTGSMAADTTQWWVPATFLMMGLSICGGMAGSTSGGLKAMRVVILIRNVKNVLRNRLHPRACNPVRLNGHPITQEIITNVMVLFVIYIGMIIIGSFLLMCCGTEPTESLGAIVGCITGFGPGLGPSGGFGSYAAFAPAAKWICTFYMVLGRLECLTVLILFTPAFWRRR